MKNIMRRFSVFMSLALVFGLSSCNYDLDLTYADWGKVKIGDDTTWASMEYNDSSWKTYMESSPEDSIYWVRRLVNLDNLKSRQNLVLRTGAIGSYDLYWDGVYINSNGNIGKKAGSQFVEGTYIHFAALPDSLCSPGEHLIAMRSVNPYEDIREHSFSLVGNYYDVTTSSLKVSLYMFLVGGVFLVAGLFFLFTFLGNRKDYSALILGAICIVFLVLFVFEYLKLFYPYPYSFQRTRLVYIGYMHAALSLLIPSFFMIQFKFPYWKWLLGAIVAGILFLEIYYSHSFDLLAKQHNKLMWGASFVIILYACWQRKKEGFMVMAGFVASMLVFWLTPLFDVPYVSSFDISLFLSFLCIIFSMLYVMTYRRKQERLAYEESLVVSERLKNELLKKNIKPHFIMNTLTTLIDWVEESPEEGVGLIHALANEFEVLNDIADHKLVPITQEIKLCKSHLKVMGYRKEIDYRWEQHGIDENEIIPPAVLHTIVENGVTHSRVSNDETITFRLTFTKEKTYKKYDLLVSHMTTDMVTSVAPDINECTGTKYIKSRLQESYGDRWNYESGPVAGGWQSTIKIW